MQDSRAVEREKAFLLALSASGLLSITSFSMLAPFLLTIADEFGTTLGAMGQLVAAMSITWGTVSLVGGAISDRLGRKPVLITGLLLMAASSFLSALAWDYPSMLVFRLIGGAGGSFVNPSVMAIVADFFPMERRGRAYSWTMTGLSLAGVVGVPLVTVLAAYTNWRWSFGAVGAVMILLALVLARMVPRDRERQKSETALLGEARRALREGNFALLLGCNTFERLSYNATTTYFASFLIAVYGVQLAFLGPILAVVALGSVLGVVLGGRVADRADNKGLVFALGQISSACFLFPLFLLAPGLLISGLIAGLFNLSGGMTRPSLAVLLSDVSQKARGVIIGMWASSNNIGHVAGASIGGMLISSGGFGSLSFLVGGASIVAAILGLLASRPAVQIRAKPPAA